MTFHPDAAVAVLIATANRPELLARALRSVERQTFCPLHIVVVDDSCDDFQGPTKQVVKQQPNVKYLCNTRIKKRAAGAWNDGLDYLLRITPDPRQLYVAILDDDDEWEPEHLQTCFDAAQGRQFDMVAAQLWRHEDGAPAKLCIPPERLDAADFLVGNPNIQGSNLFCRLGVLLEAGMFDEWLPSCTDRDLCIRIADLPGVLYGTTERTTVRHYASETHARLSTPGRWAKNEGLSRFFAKYRGRMSADQQTAFRQRAERLFGWSETVPQPDAAASPSTSPDSPLEDPSGPPPHLIVGTIADTSALADLERLGFCDRLDDSYANDVLADIERIADIRDSQIKTFLAQLPAELARHRVRLAEPAALARGFEGERVANAKAVAKRLAEPAGALGTLGCGSEGVVLTDGKHVYKVFDYWKSWQLDSTLDYLRSLVGAWRDTRSLYPLLAFHQDQEGRDAVLIYPFEPSEPYTGGHGPGLVNLLVECRQQGVVCRNIHPDNLRVVDGRVRLIDYGSDIRPLDDEREFTTMCHRAWLSFRCHDRPDLKALMRQALRQADLPVLAGVGSFHEAVLRMAGERQACEDVALELVAGQPRRVLDYGCGSGKVAKALADAGAEVLGYDPDVTRHKRWRPLADGKSDLRFTTVRDEAMAGAPFDLVVCQRVLCTIEDEAEMRGILADLRAAVAKDGRVVVTLCDPHFTFCGPTPEAERELPPGARYEDTFVWHKTVRTSGRVRREVHRPEEALLAEFARVGLREVRRVTVPTVELVNFTPASDHVAFELAPDADTPG